MQPNRKNIWKYLLLLALPLGVFALGTVFAVFYFPDNDAIHFEVFVGALLLSILVQVLILREKIMPHFVELERFRELAAEQEKGAQLLVRRDLELTRANEQLQQLDEAKSGFISVVAHQLRTPLSGIKWTLNLLINGDMGALTAEQKAFLFKAYESNDRMISLVNDMLGADRIESGKVRYQVQPSQLTEIVDNVLFELLPQANAKGLSLKFISPPKGLPMVKVDPEKLRAVFQNLLENSVKYSRTGGTIEVALAVKDNREILVSIKDDGIGIPKEQQKHIFNRFFRAPNAIRMETDGSGLGLFIVKSIVERHGGRIWFTSEEGSGVTFYFTLPMYRARVPSVEATKASAHGL